MGMFFLTSIMIEIDGSYGEGGGQIVRTALALSTLTQKPFEITNIRSGRAQPGLKAQHVAAINALKDICGAKTNPVKIGSTKLRYLPGPIIGGKFLIDIGTAGSITLLLQAVLLPLLFAQRKATLTIIGGTSGKWQAPIDYFQYVVMPHFQRFADIKCTLQKRGYYPKGQGVVVIEVKPRLHRQDADFWDKLKSVPSFELNASGTLVAIKGVSHTSAAFAYRHVAERQSHAAQIVLKNYSDAVTIRTESQRTASDGSGITVWARFHDKNDELYAVLGANALGEKSKRAEAVGTIAAERLTKEIESGAVVDMHAADQLLPFCALVGGTIRTSSVSEHAKTNMWTVEKFLPVRFLIDGKCISVKPPQIL
jgi:RNA 3'-phosphate cyclase